VTNGLEVVLQAGLVLQLELWIRYSEPTFVMACLSHRLMVTAEQRPDERVSMSKYLLPDQ